MRADAYTRTPSSWYRPTHASQDLHASEDWSDKASSEGESATVSPDENIKTPSTDVMDMLGNQDQENTYVGGMSEETLRDTQIQQIQAVKSDASQET